MHEHLLRRYFPSRRPHILSTVARRKISPFIKRSIVRRATPLSLATLRWPIAAIFSRIQTKRGFGPGELRGSEGPRHHQRPNSTYLPIELILLIKRTATTRT